MRKITFLLGAIFGMALILICVWVGQRLQVPDSANHAGVVFRTHYAQYVPDGKGGEEMLVIAIDERKIADLPFSKVEPYLVFRVSHPEGTDHGYPPLRFTFSDKGELITHKYASTWGEQSLYP